MTGGGRLTPMEDENLGADPADMMQRYAAKYHAAEHRAIVAESVLASTLARVAELEQTIADELAANLERDATAPEQD